MFFGIQSACRCSFSREPVLGLQRVETNMLPLPETPVVSFVIQSIAVVGRRI